MCIRDSPVACALHRALTLGTQQFWLRLPGQDRRMLGAHFSPMGFEDDDRLWPKEMCIRDRQEYEGCGRIRGRRR